MNRLTRGRLWILLVSVMLAGCNSRSASPAARLPAPVDTPARIETPVASADIRILFVGNSHTQSCNLPELVCDLLRKHHPGKTVACDVIGVGHLEGNVELCRSRIDAVPWTHVILQAQKISMSGKFTYPTTEGVAIARHAKDRGIRTWFFAEWPRRGEKDESARTEKIYSGMAKEAGVEVILVNRAWDLALREKPDLDLYEFDGNHEGPLGAVLTACSIAAYLTGTDPAPLIKSVTNPQPEELKAKLADVAYRSWQAHQKPPAGETAEGKK